MVMCMYQLHIQLQTKGPDHSVADKMMLTGKGRRPLFQSTFHVLSHKCVHTANHSAMPLIHRRDKSVLIFVNYDSFQGSEDS